MDTTPRHRKEADSHPTTRSIDIGDTDMNDTDTIPVEEKYLIRMSLKDMARLMAASNANHFKVQEQHVQQWIENRSRDYYAAAGEAIRHYAVPNAPTILEKTDGTE